MAKSIKSRATPAMLTWCRERAGYSDLSAVALAEKIEPELLADWESGKDSPSIAMLRRLAARYKFPLMIFYLSEPPQFSVVRDFRTLRSGQKKILSPALSLALRRARERQEWASEYLADEGASKIPFVGTVSSTDFAADVAKNLRRRIGITVEALQECRDSREAFNLWRERIEALGVITFQAHGIAVEEMRGFALPDGYAPVIGVNSSDSYNAKIFTLVHELSHIVLGESAITGSGDFDSEYSQGQREERFCNLVAAETIVPEVELRAQLASQGSLTPVELVPILSRKFKASQAVVAIRLSELGLINGDALRRILRVLQANRPKDDDKEIRIYPYRMALSRNGEYFTRLAIDAFYSGEIHGGELSTLISLKLGHMPSIEKSLFPERIQTLA